MLPHDDGPHLTPEPGQLLPAELRLGVVGTERLQQDVGLELEVVGAGQPVAQGGPALRTLSTRPVLGREGGDREGAEEGEEQLHLSTTRGKSVVGAVRGARLI